MYFKTILSEIRTGLPDPNGRLMTEFKRLFKLLPAKRQTHLNSVTQLAHKLMNLRMQHDTNYPISGNDEERSSYLYRLLIGYNLHDIGDLPINIPLSLIYSSETTTRREQIKQGDWISSGSYDAEKFDAPIRGHIISRAVHFALDGDFEIPTQFRKIIAELGFEKNDKKLLTQEEHELLALVALIAYQHHEYYDGKGWPRGLQLDPADSTMDVTFFDFIAGWFVNKMTRSANPRKIISSTPAQVLEAIDKRQAESLLRTPDGEPMYNRFWVEFMREHLDEVDDVVDEIFPDVVERNKNLT